MKFGKLASLKIQNQNYLIPYALFFERALAFIQSIFSMDIPLEIKGVKKSSLREPRVAFIYRLIVFN